MLQIGNNRGSMAYTWLLTFTLPLMIILMLSVNSIFAAYHMKDDIQDALDLSATSAVNDALDDRYRMEYKGYIFDKTYITERLKYYLQKNLNLDSDLAPLDNSRLENRLEIEDITINQSEPSVEVVVKTDKNLTIWSNATVTLPIYARTKVKNIRVDDK